MDSLGVKSYFWSISCYQASPVQAIKGWSHVELPHCLPDCVLHSSVLRFHVDLPSNGWLCQDQTGQAQPRRHQELGDFKEKTLFVNILVFFPERDLWDIALTYFLNLASQQPLESTVLNILSVNHPTDSSSCLVCWPLILCSACHWSTVEDFTFV